jgi:hypothetical protein
MKPGLVLALAGAAGLVAGISWPPPPIPHAQQAEPEWRLPSDATLQLHSKSDFQQARRDVRWPGQGSGPNDAQSTGWRLMGIAASPEPVALVMRADNSKVSRIRIGEALPDGSRIRDIRRDRVTTELDGCQTVYQLRRQKPVSTSNGCSALDSGAD